MSGYLTPIRAPIDLGQNFLIGAQKPDKDKKSGDALLTYHCGDGYLAAPNNTFPAAFKSRAAFLVYWRVKRWQGYSFNPYSLNGIHSSAALCVHLVDPADPYSFLGRWLLYTAPGAAKNAWHYMDKFLKFHTGINTGPVVEGLKAASYVLIVQNRGHADDLSLKAIQKFGPHPNAWITSSERYLSKLTSLEW